MESPPSPNPERSPFDRDVDDALRELAPPVCIECDYSLVGLPAGARCPECGAAPDFSIISIKCIAIRSPVVHFILWELAYILLIAFMPAIPIPHVSRTFLISMLVPLIITWPAIARAWYVTADVNWPYRARFSPRGFDHRLGPGAAKSVVPWDPRQGIKLKVLKKDMAVLRIRWVSGQLVPTFRSRLMTIRFQAEPEQALALKRRLDEWIMRSRVAIAVPAFSLDRAHVDGTSEVADSPYCIAKE